MSRRRLDQGRIATKRALRVLLNAIQRIYAIRWTRELGRREPARRRLVRVSTMLAFLAATSLSSKAADLPAAMQFTVLVFSKTTGFRHESIPDGIAAIEALGVEHGFGVETTEDSGHFTDAVLSRFKAVVFLSTTGDVLDENQKAAFERYIRSGGGYVGHPLCGGYRVRLVMVWTACRRLFREPPGDPARERARRGPRAPGDAIAARDLATNRRMVQFQEQPAWPRPRLSHRR
jgi:hypothetical protein